MAVAEEQIPELPSDDDEGSVEDAPAMPWPLDVPTPTPPVFRGGPHPVLEEEDEQQANDPMILQTPPAAAGPETGPALAPPDAAKAKAAESQAKPNEKDAMWAPAFFKGQRWERVNAELIDLPLIEPLAERLQVAPVVVALGFMALALAFVLYGVGGQLVCTLLGVAYPAFESFKSVEEFANLSDSDKMYQKAAGMQFWLSYWIVVGMINTFECMFYYIVVWIPFYYPLKLGTMLYLYLPNTRGANYIYRWFVSPVLKRNRDKIESTIEESGRKIKKKVGTAASSAVDATVGIGSQGVVRLRRSFSSVGPGIDTVRRIVGSEISRRRATNAASTTGVEAEANE